MKRSIRNLSADERRKKHIRLRPSDRKLNGPLKIKMHWRDAVKFALTRGPYRKESA